MTDDKKTELPKWYKDTRKKEISASGNLIFTLLRLLDLPLQYHLLSSGLGSNIVRRLGGAPISQALTTPATAIGLPPYQSLVWSLAVGAAAKQIYWCLFVCDNAFEPTFSTTVAAYNTVLNTLNTLLSLWSISSNYPARAATWTELFTSAPNKSTVPLGVGLYVLGLFVEWYCEVQRKRFKQDPANKGKLYTGGLFGLARNINYGGYTIWRVGYSIICAGLPWGVGVGMFLFGDFAARAVPYLETHLKEKVSAARVGGRVSPLLIETAVWSDIRGGQARGALCADSRDLLASKMDYRRNSLYNLALCSIREVIAESTCTNMKQDAFCSGSRTRSSRPVNERWLLGVQSRVIGQ